MAEATGGSPGGPDSSPQHLDLAPSGRHGNAGAPLTSGVASPGLSQGDGEACSVAAAASWLRCTHPSPPVGSSAAPPCTSLWHLAASGQVIARALPSPPGCGRANRERGRHTWSRGLAGAGTLAGWGVFVSRVYTGHWHLRDVTWAPQSTLVVWLAQLSPGPVHVPSACCQESTPALECAKPRPWPALGLAFLLLRGTPPALCARSLSVNSAQSRAKLFLKSASELSSGTAVTIP